MQKASYYFQKGNLYYQQNKLDKALLFYKKTIEVEPDNSIYHYNMACLLTRMGHLENANRIFSFIVQQMDPSLTECYFLMAVNYGLLDDLEKARYYLNLYLQFSPDGEMAMDAEDLLFALSEGEVDDSGVFRENEPQPVNPRKEDEEILRGYLENQAVRSFLWQSLYHSNGQIAEKAVSIFGLLSRESGEEALREFVRNPWVKQRLRLQALLKLKNMGVRGLVAVFMEGSLRDIDLSYYPLVSPRWLEEWQKVLDATLDNMRSNELYDERFLEDAQAIWIDFINNTYPRVPNIKKVAVWAAGLEYALARYHFISLTQKALAGRYGVSTSSISGKYREINEVLNIEHKAYHNVLKYLTQRDKD